MSDERTPRTWGINVWPTAQQLADWLKVCTDAERLEHATIALQDAQDSMHCLSQHGPEDRSRPEGSGNPGVTGAQPDEPVTQAGRPAQGDA